MLKNYFKQKRVMKYLCMFYEAFEIGQKYADKSQ